jgi:hypothetical protein
MAPRRHRDGPSEPVIIQRERPMLTKYLNMALILALVAVAGVTNYYTSSGPQRIAEEMPAAAAMAELPN